MATRFDYRLSRHASMRCQQRGITSEVLEALLDEADAAVPAGTGAYARYVTRRCQQALLAEGVSPQTVERLADVCLVEAGRTVITAFRGRGRKARRYRRGR